MANKGGVVRVSAISVKLKGGKVVELSVEEARALQKELNALFSETTSPDILKKLEEDLKRGGDRVVPIPVPYPVPPLPPSYPWMYEPTIVWMQAQPDTAGWRVSQSNGVSSLSIDTTVDKEGR